MSYPIVPVAHPGPPWLTFTHENTPGLVNDNINAIMCDAEGTVWMATDGGVSSCQAGHWGSITDPLAYVVYGTETPSISMKVTSLTEEKDKSMWFGLEGGGVRRFIRSLTPPSWQQFTTQNVPKFPFDAITSIAATRPSDPEDPGDVWIGTLFGVVKFHLTANNTEQGIWSGPTSWPLTTQEVRAIAVNPQDNLICFGTQDNGPVFLRPDGKWINYGTVLSYDQAISSISFVRFSDIVWYSTWDGVTSYNLATGEYHHYTTDNTQGKLPLGIIHAVAMDPRSPSVVWFGSDDGLVEWNNGTWSLFSHSTTPELPSGSVTALADDSRGNLWIGTANGVAVYNPSGTEL